MNKDPERREGAGVGTHGSKPQERNLGCRDLVITLSEFFRPW